MKTLRAGELCCGYSVVASVAGFAGAVPVPTGVEEFFGEDGFDDGIAAFVEMGF